MPATRSSAALSARSARNAAARWRIVARIAAENSSPDHDGSVRNVIIPDDKNWTWVLERACPDCGFAAGTFDVANTGAAVRDLAARWTAVLDRADVSQRPNATTWSPLEYGCHVRDVFRIFDRRLAMMIEQVDPQFENWDQDKTAIDDNYAGQQSSVVASDLSGAAVRLADRFDSVQADQWQRRGFRSDGSVFTVRTIAQYLLHDPVHHLWDVGAPVPKY